MTSRDYDIVVLGAGPGGYVAAIRAAQLGFRTAIVERAHLGGICLNWGCIPTKALLRSAEIYRMCARANEFGVTRGGKTRVDLKTLVGRSRTVAGELNTGVGFLLKKNGVDVIWGEACIAGPGKLAVRKLKKAPEYYEPSAPKDALGPGDYAAQHIIVATGARPRVLPGLLAYKPADNNPAVLEPL